MKRNTVLITVVTLALVTLACSPCGLISNFTVEEGELPEVIQPEPSGEQPTPPSEPGGEQPTSPPVEPGAAPEIADLDALDSYRVQQTIRVENQDGSELQEITVLEEWVREPPAQHVVISGSAMPATEIILIGDKAWMKAGDTWMEMPAEQAPDFTSGMDITPDMEDGMMLAGEETVNGINCKHYTVDEESFAMADPTEGSVTVRIQGEVWIADQPGLPLIVVREKMRVEGSFIPVPDASSSAEGGTTYFEKEVTDINQPITIEPPQ
ncbi:MAG: hypothetical protein U9R15_01570 [Chloroflexota bacterium]|nr:hypothetical protein [Chloroflexota bacterium]